MRKTKQVSILLLAKMAVNIVRAQHNTFFSCRGRRRSDGGVGLDLDGGAAAEKWQTHKEQINKHKVYTGKLRKNKHTHSPACTPTETRQK